MPPNPLPHALHFPTHDNPSHVALLLRSQIIDLDAPHGLQEGRPHASQPSRSLPFLICRRMHFFWLSSGLLADAHKPGIPPELRRNAKPSLADGTSNHRAMAH